MFCPAKTPVSLPVFNDAHSQTRSNTRQSLKLITRGNVDINHGRHYRWDSRRTWDASHLDRPLLPCTRSKKERKEAKTQP
jgi:hypothetical protein